MSNTRNSEVFQFLEVQAVLTSDNITYSDHNDKFLDTTQIKPVS